MPSMLNTSANNKQKFGVGTEIVNVTDGMSNTKYEPIKPFEIAYGDPKAFIKKILSAREVVKPELETISNDETKT